MKPLNARVKKLEKIKKKPAKFGYNEFFKKCIDLVDGATRGIPSEHRGQTPEQIEQQKQLFEDYPEHAEKFQQLMIEVENQ
jgi:hypothetical protein